ncbi:MAG: DUF1361 domain-containing protein [Tannerella sp.]|nr:DUF1361 domain-containing protein [Tannerella sp.]
MLKSIRKSGRLNEIILMAVLSLLCFSLSIFRFIYSDTKTFLFLNWNLFLAFIPWALSTLLIIRPSIQRSKILICLLLLIWLLFFPNAPYILTDLFHLRLKLSMPIWFDLVLILSFAWTGLLFGFFSLWDIEQILLKSMKKTTVRIISVMLLFMGSFGIYVGRYLRWNSWDIITEPFRLAYDIGDRLINPFEHPRTWGMTILMGTFLNILYWSFHLVRKRK